MGDFIRDTAVRRGPDGALQAALSEDWAIWGPNGGYIASIALRAAGIEAPAGHRPASFSCQYLSAAAFDEIDITVEPLRRGRSAWCLNVALNQGGKLFLQAQVWTTDRAVGPDRSDAQPPAVPDHAALKDFRELDPDRPIHKFWSHFDSKPVHYLADGVVNPRGAIAEGWYRLRGFESDGDPFVDGARALLLLDTLPWPTFWRAEPEPPKYIAPSLDLTAWFHAPAFESDWLLIETCADTAAGGLIHGHSRIWTADGRRFASGGSQLLVVDRG